MSPIDSFFADSKIFCSKNNYSINFPDATFSIDWLINIFLSEFNININLRPQYSLYTTIQAKNEVTLQFLKLKREKFCYLRFAFRKILLFELIFIFFRQFFFLFSFLWASVRFHCRVFHKRFNSVLKHKLNSKIQHTFLSVPGKTILPPSYCRCTNST